MTPIAIRMSRFGPAHSDRSARNAVDSATLEIGTGLASAQRRGLTAEGATMFRIAIPAALVLMVGVACSESETRYDVDLSDAESPDADEGFDAAMLTWRFDVFPTTAAASDDGDLLLPQTFEVPTETDVIDLRLRPPVRLEGAVTAYQVGPLARSSSPLPGAEVPVRGSLGLWRDGSVHGRTIALDDLGGFALTVVPDVGYHLSVVPADPSLPVFTSALALDRDTVIDLDIGAGAPMWGMVRDGAGAPLQGVSVRARSLMGVATPTTTTAADGSYLLRVSPGAWRIEALGRGNGRDPALASASVEVAAEGRQIDVVYETLTTYAVGGRLAPGTGPGVRDGRVRFTATALEGYETSAKLTVEARADNFGNFDTQLLAGRYRVEAYPADDQHLTPVDLGEVRVSGTLDLGLVTLPPGVNAEGVVLDPEGAPVAGALVDCEEIGFARRFYSTHTDAAGHFAFSVPRVALQCDLVPPGDRADLALTRRVVSFTAAEAALLVLDQGVLIEGRAHYDQAGTLRPLELAVIEVRDQAGQLLGTTLSRAGDGSFSVRITAPIE